MALATQEMVEAWIGRQLSPSEEGRVEVLLARADALVMGYLGCAEAPTPVPTDVSATVAEMVGRLLSTASRAGLDQLSIDDATAHFTADASSGGVWLSKADKLALRRHRCGGGMTSVQFVGERYKIAPEGT